MDIGGIDPGRRILNSNFFRRVVGNKRGSMIVEAAIVIPLLILTIMSIIFLIIYFYSCLDNQMDLHRGLVKKVSRGVNIIRIEREERSTLKKFQGTFSGRLGHRDRARVYVINESVIIRMGREVEALAKE